MHQNSSIENILSICHEFLSNPYSTHCSFCFIISCSDSCSDLCSDSWFFFIDSWFFLIDSWSVSSNLFIRVVRSSLRACLVRRLPCMIVSMQPATGSLVQLYFFFQELGRAPGVRQAISWSFVFKNCRVCLSIIEKNYREKLVTTRTTIGW